MKNGFFPIPFEYFLLLAILVHGLIALSVNFEPIFTPLPPPKILVILSPPIIPTTELTSKKTVSIANTDVKIAHLTKSLEQKFNTYAKRQRRRSISANTKDQNYSNYLEKWRRKVETIGNQNYPALARQLKLQGSLILQLTLYNDGSIQQVQIIHSSGHKMLDDAALYIIQLAAPYEPFPKEMRKEIDILDITRIWQFTSEINANEKIEIDANFSMLNTISKP